MPLNDDVDDEFDSKIEDESTYPTPATEIGELVERRYIAPDNGSGSFAEDGQIEVVEDSIMMNGESQMGGAADDGQTEIGDDVQAPFESFMLSPTRMGDANTLESQYEIGSAAMYGPTEIGESEIGLAVAKVVEKARDNRQAAPPMKVVDIDSDEPFDDDDYCVTETLVGIAVAADHPDPFPLTTEFMLRCGAGCPPRIVRVDTEESYKAFRTENSPELSALADHVEELEGRLSDHIADPDAHNNELADDIEDLTVLGEDAHAAEDDKRVELWMPKHYDGLVTAWREGDFVCASMALPGADGEVRICTSLEPVKRCIAEMSKHASEAGVPAATVVGVLPAMGCVLGAGTLLKEMAAAAPEIVRHKAAAGKQPFMVRIEPKMNPALSALAMLVMACRAGNAQACQEWQNLSSVAPPPVRQAMAEAIELAKAAA